MEQIEIMKEFIKKWSPLYDEPSIGGDEPDYKDILNKVQEELKTNKTLTKDTFTNIIEWKSPRAKGKVDWNNFQFYQTAIQYVPKVPDELKLSLLCGLDGVGLPVGSTILHFMYPDTFPIVDYRVTEVLHDAGLLPSYTISDKAYRKYKAAIEELVKQTGCNIRTIDRALFSFPKLNY